MSKSFWLTAVLGLGLDQVVKFFLKSLQINKGVAFGLGQGINWILIDVLLLSLVIYKFRKDWRLGLVVAGGVSNLIDRIRFGGAVDYIELFKLGFNLADVMIVVGVSLIIYSELYEGKKDIRG